MSDGLDPSRGLALGCVVGALLWILLFTLFLIVVMW